MVLQAHQKKKREFQLKAWMAQAVELPTKQEGMASNSSTTTPKKKKKK
jgi:hypothetical protein